MKHSVAPRKHRKLSPSIHNQLNKYVLAASAAGVGALALAQSAEGKVVYTPAHIELRINHGYAIDLNHDGTPDVILNWLFLEGTSLLRASIAANSNGVATRPEKSQALAIYKGAKIGAARNFASVPVMAGAYVNSVSNPKWYGPWAGTGQGVDNRYLGIKFTVNGKPYYGWARVTVRISKRVQEVLLSGYAYETIPGKHIIAGKTTGHDVVVEPATLGRLAAGRR